MRLALALFIALTLVLSLSANIGALFAIKKLYLQVNQVRLDPLQLSLYEQPDTSEASGKKRVVMFGDSRALSWPAPESETFEFINRGIGQQTSEQIRLRYDQHLGPIEADVVVLQLCVNDLKVIPLVPEKREDIVNQCKRNLLEIIDKTRAKDATVILSTIFPLGKVPLDRKLFWSEEVAMAIHEINEFIWSQEADGVLVFGSFGLLQGEKDLIKPEYSRDLLHLNTAGYSMLNRELLDLLESLNGEETTLD